MNVEPTSVRLSDRRPRLRYFLQFSLRSLLLLVTAAAIVCWWFLRPQVREEQLGGTPLRLRREIRVVKFDPISRQPWTARPNQFETINGQQFAIINAGQWRVFDSRRNLLVDGRYDNGQEHGKWTIYHVSGRKAAEGMMLHGKKIGRWRAWDEEGRLLSDGTYTDSKH